MNVNWFELVNVLLAAGLITAVWRDQKISIIFVLFLYGTLHFAYSSFVLFSRDSAQLLIDMHANGSGVTAFVSGVVVLMASYASLVVLAYRTGSEIIRNKITGAPGLLVVSAVCLLAGYYMNYRAGDHGQALNVASLVAIFAFLMLVHLNEADSGTSTEKYALILFVILLAVVGVAVYEVVANKAWSVFRNSDGVMVARASSFLFNPNLLAYWLSLIYIAIVYTWQTRLDKNSLCYLAMILVAIGLYVSGSRSGLTLLIAALMFSAIILRSRKSVYAILTLIATVAVAYIVSLGMLPSHPWDTLAVLGQRYEMAFIHLYGYLASSVGSAVPVPPEVEISIEGRFVGSTSDSGWLVLYQDAGVLGVFGFFGVILFLMMKLFRMGELGSGFARASVLAALFYCVVSGLVMRFQIFPVWLFFGVVMAIAINILKLNQKHSR